MDILSDNAVIQELDTVILVKGRSDQGLVKGDMGAVVMVQESGKAFEVEFVTLAGDTLGALPLTPDEVRPNTARDVPYVRMA